MNMNNGIHKRLSRMSCSLKGRGSRALSREEEAELLRSKKKVKDVNHADFREGANENDSYPRNNNAWVSPNKSFKEKLVGEIPGAYAQAFDFYDQMEDDVDSDKEVSGLREGLAAIKLSKETKRRIRGSWSKALIVKLYGRKIGFTYIQNKLQQLWKPSGRLDCVDLGNEFFLMRFSMKEDLDAVLRKGPWFIGEHYLSIRPWEPFFNPDAAIVSSIAVWVRLHRLPIELYEAEVLKQIGEAIGKVLRVDTHTAMEARGKYARLCIQVDANKPLINTVLIGKFEQAVVYEGINKLCFECGRIGHKKEACPYIIRCTDSPPEKELSRTSTRTHSTSPRRMHDSGWRGAGSDVAESSGTAHEEDKYRPWMVVTRRKGGQKWTTKGVEQSEPTKSGQSSKQKDSLVRIKASDENRAWKACSEMGLTPKINVDMAGQDLLSLGPNLKFGGLIDKNGLPSKAHESPSVKAKKALARNRALTHLKKEVASCSKISFPAAQAVSLLGNNGGDESSPFQFSAAAHTDPGTRCEGEVERLQQVDRGTQSQGKLNHPNTTVGGSGTLELAEECVGVDSSQSEEGLETRCSLLISTERKNENYAVGGSNDFRERNNGKENGEDRMEFEDEGGTGISS